MPFAKKLSSLHRLALLERMLGAGVIEIPMDGSEWTASPGALTIFGIPHDGQSGIGRTIVDLFHLEDRRIFSMALALIQAETVPPRHTYRVRIANGQIRHVAIRFEILSDVSGRPQRFVGVLWDVTEEATANRAQNKIGRLLDTLAAGLDVDVIWRTDHRGRLMDHYARGNLARTLQPVDHQWQQFVNADDARLVQGRLAAGEPFTIFVDVLCEDGQIRRCVNRGVPFKDETGRIAEWCGVISEVRSHGAGAAAHSHELSDIPDYITGAGLRAGCGMLRWSHEEYAYRSGLSPMTIRRMISTAGRLHGLFRRGTIESAVKALAEAGMEFHLSNEQKVFIAL